MAARYTQGTIKAAQNLDTERQAEFLRKSMRGIGTDERRIIQILTSHNNDQRQEIAKKYKQMYGRDLVDDLKTELSGCFEEAVVALLVPSRKFDTINIHKAVTGIPQPKMCIEILCPRTNAEIVQIKELYKAEYNESLEERTERALLGTDPDFKRLIKSQLTAGREENEEVDEDKVKKDAQEFYDAGEAIVGTDESVFNKVLSMRSYPHLLKFFDEYKKVSSKDIVDTIKSETSGLLQEALLAIVKWTRDRHSYIAERFHETMKGAGTDDSQLIRLLVSHSETDLETIKEKFMSLYNKSLHAMVEDDTSGDYRKLLSAILTGSMTPP